MKLEKELEKKVKKEAFIYLEKGREGWGIPHTIATVYWMRKLIEKEGGNEKILVTTMYLHDIGYQVKKNDGFDTIMAGNKLDHEEIGAALAEKILKKTGGFSPEETNHIVHLVRYHDHLDNIDSHDSQMVMEADSLGAIDWERVKPNFTKEDTARYLEHFKKNRVNKFQTKTGKKFLKEVLEKAEKYLNEWKK